MESTEQSSGRRLGVLTIDQAISGASNVLIAVLAARLLDVESFGLFWIVFLSYGVLVGGARALVGDPLLVNSAESEERAGDAIGAGCLIGLGVGAVTLLGGVVAHVWDARLGDAFMALGVCAPLLVLQDLGRYLGMATRRPVLALVLDVVWLVVMFAGMGFLVVTDARSLWQFIAVWGGSGAIAGLLVFWQHRDTRVHLSLGWLRQTWHISWRYLISYSSAQGSVLITAILLTAIAGAKAMGAVQGALLMQRPFTVFVIASMATGVVDVSRSSGARRTVHRIAIKITILTTVVAALNGLVPFLLPDNVGEAVLGASWHPAQPLFLAAAAQTVMMGLVSGARSGLLGQRAISLAVRIDVLKTALVVVSTVVGAILGGAIGAMWAVAVGHGLGATIWWAAFRFHTNKHAPDDAATDDPEIADRSAEPEPAVDSTRGSS